MPVVAAELAAGADGRTVVVAAERRSGPLPFVTFGFAAGTGAKYWLAESGDADVSRAGPRSLLISPDGKCIVVTGRTRLVDERFTYFTTYAYELLAGCGFDLP